MTTCKAELYIADDTIHFFLKDKGKLFYDGYCKPTPRVENGRMNNKI